MTHLRTYTVVGLIDHDSDELEIAGVLLGEHRCIDSTANAATTRWSTYVQASNVDDAEENARCVFEFGDVPSTRSARQLMLGATVLDDMGNGHVVTAMKSDGGHVLVWFDPASPPKRYSENTTLRTVDRREPPPLSFQQDPQVHR